jgi:hypothetical protein
MSECRGTNQIGGGIADVMGFCTVCKRLVRLRVGTGRLVSHDNPFQNTPKRGSEALAPDPRFS